ncbi:ABC branched amino acid transporter family, periplasmic substrate-binding protein [Oceaniovalibus guishaninsula JLT2003]|uniref:ABC branched amino acid transporter family, periplasmic substrate-binding protein n=1 Tax=Oceaniovalibus guishaninsula JLT2003 TaxID=1231392 RepID=K2I866_9RHOB|nr:ABC transporter substrate-binding protein [Oceaniovalibus guishaninsula]EKE45220.1 ABC branched amino acid transporter family, periplasmic substrate-binding protein [Oceaniovalibus guishaninsula JLT2003]
MKKLLSATAISAIATAAAAQDAGPVKIGILLGYTGPIESIVPGMTASAEMAISQINEAGGILGGRMLEAVRADSTCIDSAAATAAAERMVTSDGVAAIMGADCSGVTGAVLANVAVPNGIAMISPSATSPGLSSADDNDLFFRTSPSDARQGEVLAQILADQDIDTVAVTYTNNDYGKGLSDAFIQSFEAQGGTVTLNAPHEDGKADYSAEIGALDSAGGDVLVVLGYGDQGGKGIIRSALDAGSFDRFMLADGMYMQSLLDDVGAAMDGSFGAVPWSEGEGTSAFQTLADEAQIDAESTYTRESYDAMALLAMAMQAAGSTDANEYKSKVMEVANAPGEPILPGELGKAMQILADGGDVDYVGATNVELIGAGEAAGNYREYVVKDGEYETVTFR